jgi:uncharacterized protein with gpF-like domain
MTPAQLIQDIEADLKHAQGAYRRLTKDGQRRLAEDMRRQVDDFLDELKAAKAGAWRPAHA